MCGEDGKVGGEGESLNKCSGFGAILFIRAGGCDVYRLVRHRRATGVWPSDTIVAIRRHPRQQETPASAREITGL